MFKVAGKKIWIAGHTGLVGSALCRKLKTENCQLLMATHIELDLTRQSETEEWLAEHRPDGVIIAAAHVGGIQANSAYPAEFIYNNLAMAQNIIHGSYLIGVKKLLFLGSSCIYPKLTNNPIQEDALLSGLLEPTNEPYAMSKIASIKLCESYRNQHGCDFISAMPCNLYGENDTYNLENSHVIPALIMKIHEAKKQRLPSVEIWGSGKPLREFLYVDDLSDALVHLFINYSDTQHINVGAGYDISIHDLAQTICDVIGYKGKLEFNTDKPDGVMQKLMDSSKIEDMGWKPKTDLKSGLSLAYQDYINRALKHAA